jgi:hypothetical protein
MKIIPEMCFAHKIRNIYFLIPWEPMLNFIIQCHRLFCVQWGLWGKVVVNFVDIGEIRYYYCWVSFRYTTQHSLLIYDMLYYISITYRKCSSHRMVGEFSGTVVDQQYMMPHTWDMLGKSCITIVLFLWPRKCSSHRMVGELSGTVVDQESMMPHT